MSSDGEKEKSTEDMAKDKCETDAAAAVAAAKESQEASAATSADDKQVDEADGDKDLNSAAATAGEKSKDGKGDDDSKTDKKAEVDAKDEDKEDDDDEEEEEEESKDTAAVDKKSSEKSADKDKNGTADEKKGKKAEEDDDDEEKKEEEEDEEDLKAPMPLGEIAKINDNITKTKVEGLQTLHTILYEVPGKFNVAKKNLRKFAGFNFKKSSDEYKSKVEAIDKFELKLLQGVCEILDLETTGAKEEVSARIMEFLMCPEGDPEREEEDAEEEQEEEDPAEEAISSEEDTKRKRKRAPERSTKSSGRPRRSTAGKTDLSAYVDYSSSDESTGRKVQQPKRRRRKNDSDSGSDYNPSAGGSDSEAGRKRASAAAARGRGRTSGRRGRRRQSESEEESASLEEDSDEPKKKRGRPAGRPAARNKRGRKKHETESEEESEPESDNSEDMRKKKSKAPPAKANNKSKGSPANASRGKKQGRPRKAESSGENDKDESEDEPLSKRTKSGPPTDEEIKVYVKEILDEANLEEITMKTVCKQVYAKYPDFDLTDKKDFIKATVKSDNQPSTIQGLYDSEANVYANDEENVQFSAAATVSQDSTRGDMSTSFVSPVIQTRRKNPIELQEAGKLMKYAITTLDKVLDKQEVPEDDCELYGKILANKLRKLPELERMQLMWEIDGLYIRTIERKPLHAANRQFIPSSSPSPTSDSSYSAYSDTNISQRLISPHYSSSYSTPSPTFNNIDIPAIQIPESSEQMPPEVFTILSNDVIAPAKPATFSGDNNVNKAFF